MSITIKLQGQYLQIDKRFCQVSELLKELYQAEKEHQFVLETEHVTQQTFQVIRQYYEFNNFTPKIIEKIDKNPDICFLNSHDKELIMQFDVQGNQLKELLNAATYFNTKAFRKLCLARIAIEYPLERVKLCVNNGLNVGDVERQKKWYPQLIQNFI